MAASDETAVPLSKRKVLLLVFGAVGFVALGAWLFQLDAAWIESQRRFNDPLLVHAFGVIAIVFFGACGLVGIRKLFDCKPGVGLSSSGILITSGAAPMDLIPWCDITRFDTYVLHNQKFLVVKLVD